MEQQQQAHSPVSDAERALRAASEVSPSAVAGIASTEQESPALSGDTDDARIVVWEGRAFLGIRRLGFVDSGAFVLDFYTTPAPMPRGGYCTGIPISPTYYRERRPTKCAFKDEGSQVVVWCDWGRMHRIAAPRDVLDPLIANMKANALPEKPPAP